MKSLFNFVILILFLLVLSLNFVSGFGVSIPYSVQDPLRLYPGQSAEVIVGLQSSINEGDLIIVPEILEGQDIVNIVDTSKEYNVRSNQPVGAAIHLKVSIPDNENIKKEYTIKLVLRDITKKEGRMIGVSTSIGASFNVSVIEELKQPELKRVKGTKVFFLFELFLLIAIVAIILIIWFVVRKRKNKFLGMGDIEKEYL